MDVPWIYLSWPKYWAISIPREIQLDSTDSTVSSSYLEKVKVKLAETPLVKPKNNLPPSKQRALKELINKKEIILKKADKGTTTVVINRENKNNEGQIQITISH